MSADKVPDLDSFLTGRQSGPCSYVRTVPREYRDKIDEKVTQGVRSWKAFGLWLAAMDIEVGDGLMYQHYSRGHGPDA